MQLAGYASGIAVAICAIALSFGAPQSAYAQAATTAPNNAIGTTAPRAGAPQGTASKPVGIAGKRQPRRSDVPETSGSLQPSPEDRALDRSLRSICKGC